MRTGSGMVSVQQAKPTHPEDDRHVDPAMPRGSTSKTWNPAQDHEFWTEHDQSRDTGSAASASQAMPIDPFETVIPCWEGTVKQCRGRFWEGRGWPDAEVHDSLREIRERVNHALCAWMCGLCASACLSCVWILRDGVFRR